MDASCVRCSAGAWIGTGGACSVVPALHCAARAKAPARHASAAVRCDAAVPSSDLLWGATCCLGARPRRGRLASATEPAAEPAYADDPAPTKGVLRIQASRPSWINQLAEMRTMGAIRLPTVACSCPDQRRNRCFLKPDSALATLPVPPAAQLGNDRRCAASYCLHRRYRNFSSPREWITFTETPKAPRVDQAQGIDKRLPAPLARKLDRGRGWSPGFPGARFGGLNATCCFVPRPRHARYRWTAGGAAAGF